MPTDIFIYQIKRPLSDKGSLILNICVRRFHRFHPMIWTIYSISTALGYLSYLWELERKNLLLKIQWLNHIMLRNQTGIQLETSSLPFSFLSFEHYGQQSFVNMWFLHRGPSSVVSFWFHVNLICLNLNMSYIRVRFT